MAYRPKWVLETGSLLNPPIMEGLLLGSPSDHALGACISKGFFPPFQPQQAFSDNNRQLLPGAFEPNGLRPLLSSLRRIDTSLLLVWLKLQSPKLFGHSNNWLY